MKVELRGVEPLTSSMPLRRSSQLSYSPKVRIPARSAHVTGATGDTYGRSGDHLSPSQLPGEFGLRRSLGAPVPGSHLVCCRALCRDGLLLPFIVVDYGWWS